MPKLSPSLSLACFAALGLTACGQPEPKQAPTDSQAVRDRAFTAQTANEVTGAEIQQAASTSLVRTVYLCQDSEKLTVDFDNPRRMATVRNSSGIAVDLNQVATDDGLLYVASGHELRGKDAVASWTAPEKPVTQCRAIN